MIPSLLGPGIGQAMNELTRRRRVTASQDAVGGERVAITAAGYLLHIVGQTEVVCCALDSPGWPHFYGLVLPGAALPRVEPPFQAVDQHALLVLDGWDVTVGVADADPGLVHRRGSLEHGIPKNDPQDPASWTILELMPDFQQFCVGARLAADWESRTGIVGTLRMRSGSVGTRPCAYTYKQTWSWDGPTGRHEQALADILDYTSHPGTRVGLTLAPRDGSVPPRTVTLEPAPGAPWSLLLLGLPHGWTPTLDPIRQYELELSHVHATLRLCDVAGEDYRAVLAPIPTPIDPQRVPPGESGFFEIMLPGKINCAGRLMFA